jgi:predicted ATP-dependent protease
MVASIKDAMGYVQSQHLPSLYDERIVISFDHTVEVFFGGDSAGGALAVAAISQKERIIPQDDVCMTGSIRSFDDIRAVGGIQPKAKAAAEKGFQILLVPEENKDELEYLELETLDQLEIITGKVTTDFLCIALPTYKDSANPAAVLALKRYAIAVNLTLNRQASKALTVLDQLVKDYPAHYSAMRLRRLLEIAGYLPDDSVPPSLLK